MKRSVWHNRVAGAWPTGSSAERATSRFALRAGPEALVLACSECCLDAALSVFAPGQALIWRTPGNEVALDPLDGRGPLAAALRSGIRNLVVLGHSRCGWVERQVREARPARSGEAIDRILGNIRLAQRVKAEAMNNIVGQLEALRGIPAVAEAVHSGGLSLHGWLYLDETGLFMSYDDESGCFVPTGAGT